VCDLFFGAKGEQSYGYDSPCEVMWDFLATLCFFNMTRMTKLMSHTTSQRAYHLDCT